MKALIKRYDMYGDVLVATSVLPALKAKGYEIDFLCNPGYEVVLENNPYISRIVRDDGQGYDLSAYLDHATCWDDWMGKCMARQIGVEWSPHQVYFTEHELDWAKRYKGCIAIGTRAGWRSRQYRNWDQVVRGLRDYRLVQVDNSAQMEFCERPSLTIREMMAVISVSGLYMGVDSLPMHVAAATRTPMVVAMGATGAEIQYMPCSTVLRPFDYFSIFDERYVLGIDFPATAVIDAVKNRIDNGGDVSGCPITQWVGCDGAIEKTQCLP